MYPQRANVPLKGLDRHVLTLGAISGPHCQIGAFHWCHFIIRGFTWSAKSILEKADQSKVAILVEAVDIHSYLVYVALSWGNKMSFNLHAKMSGFCSDSHKYAPHYDHSFSNK